MNRIIWNQELATGFADIDEQHRRLIAILDRLATRTDAAVDAIGGEPHRPAVVLTRVELEQFVDDLGEYAREHFATEVGLMLDSCCDLRHVQKHVREHENFIRHMSLVREALSDSREDEGAELARYLGEWFARHIAGSDRSMARQVQRIRAGQSPEEAYAAEMPSLALVA